MEDGVYQKNEDGSWSPAKPIGYFLDARPFWLKVIEFPFRLIGLIRYDPLVEIPYDEWCEWTIQHDDL